MSDTRGLEYQTFNLSELPGIEVYSLLTNLIVPRPIALVSTISASGLRNLAPFSYFNLGGSNPPSVVFSPAGQGGGSDKDTLANIKETGEYVINLVTKGMADQMNKTSANLPAEDDEWTHSGFSPIPSALVKPERVADSPAHLECRLFEVVRHGNGPGCANYVIGEVLAIHLSKSLETSKRLTVDPISRLGGADYLDLSSLTTFSLERPE